MPASKRGSATVEAALIIPLLVLIIIGLIKIGSSYEEKVKNASYVYRADGALVSQDTLLNTEDILRGRWCLE